MSDKESGVVIYLSWLYV